VGGEKGEGEDKIAKNTTVLFTPTLTLPVKGEGTKGVFGENCKEVYRAICRPGLLFSTTSFTDPLDSGLPDSYLFYCRENQMDTFYPSGYLQATNMDKKYPL
jgi:hypothetical protein